METFAFGLHRLVHLDLKGAPPKVAYLEKLFPTLRHWGATGIIVEWEDTFPYTNELIQLGGNSELAAVLNAPYTLADVAQILQLAEDNDLLVIQLIQTIGHMEFVLKCPIWQSLREVPTYPSSMCPSHDGALPLVKMILTQALAVQKNAQYIHIGADEVWHMGMCTTCQRRACESKHGKSSLFLEHVSRVATFIKELRPQLKIIMWDDMLRGMDINAIQAYDLGSLVEPMVWHYNSEDSFLLGSALWDKYNLVFDRLWVASAFKGASGSCQILPAIKHHISNHEAWMKEIERNRSRIKKINGIALTGWSRYDHYATLCELLPAALPSLAFCLQTWLTNTSEHNERTRVAVFDATSALLGYNPEKPLPMESAMFPGWQITKSVHGFAVLRDRFRALVFGDILLLESNALDLYMRSQMDQVFFPHTVEEWHGTNIAPIVAQLQQLKSDTEFQINLGCCVRGMKRTF